MVKIVLLIAIVLLLFSGLSSLYDWATNTGIEIANENAISQQRMYKSFWTSVTAAYDRAIDIRRTFKRGY